MLGAVAMVGSCLPANAQEDAALLPPPRPEALRPGPTSAPPRPAPPGPDKRQAGASLPVREADSACPEVISAVPGNRVRAVSIKASEQGCTVLEPVTVEALAIRGPAGALQIRIDPPVTLACDMARVVADWLDTTVQPLARGHFGRDLASLRVGGGHECRRRNRSTAGPLSEHATGRALDVFGFMLAGPEPDAGVTVEAPKGQVQSRFLEAVRQSACGAFATALGPGSDAAHADHLHLDIMERRSAASRFCQ